MLPDTYSGEISTSSIAEGRWWKSFQEPDLDRLIEMALAGNLGFKRAYARLAQAQATYDGATASWWPSINYDINASNSQRVINFGGGAQSFTQNQLTMSLTASYEVDIWGKIYSQTRAADLELQASQKDIEALAMSLSAQIAEAWFQLAQARATERLLRDQIDRNQTQLELIETRFGQGISNALDVFQQRQALQASKVQLPTTLARIKVLEHQLATLLGLAPTAPLPAMPQALADLPPLPAMGVPVKLLDQRPDVRAARLRVIAADFRIGAAFADQFPALTLSANAGMQSFEFQNFFENWFYTLTAGLTGPLFDAGRRASEVDRTQAVLEDQLNAYGETVLTALQEVEDALVQEKEQHKVLKELSEQLQLARSTYDEALNRYINGLSEYLPVLTALQTVQGLEQQHLEARRQLLSFRVQLCRALGGTWMSEVDRPLRSPAVPDSGDKL